MKKMKWILGLQVFLLVAWVGMGTAVAKVHPRINSVTFTPASPFGIGDTITVTLRGEPGGTATFDITKITDEIPMSEVSRGVYQGTYVVKVGDATPFASVTGRLMKNGKERNLVAKLPVVIKETQ